MLAATNWIQVLVCLIKKSRGCFEGLTNLHAIHEIFDELGVEVQSGPLKDGLKGIDGDNLWLGFDTAKEYFTEMLWMTSA